jgi:hypothetical protein
MTLCPRIYLDSMDFGETLFSRRCIQYVVQRIDFRYALV